MSHFYTCAICGGEFVSTWTKEEAEAEELQVFNVGHSLEDAEVCDDCYQIFMASMKG